MLKQRHEPYGIPPQKIAKEDYDRLKQLVDLGNSGFCLTDDQLHELRAICGRFVIAWPKCRRERECPKRGVLNPKPGRDGMNNDCKRFGLVKLDPPFTLPAFTSLKDTHPVLSRGLPQ